jgi:hypothetical protein
MFRGVLFKEVFFVHAFGIALQRERTSRKMRQQDRRDARIVIDNLSLSEPGCGVKYLVQVSQTQMFAFDLNYLGFAGHGIQDYKGPICRMLSISFD